MPKRDSPAPTVDRLADACVECGVCVKECGFLQRHGTPKALAGLPDAADLSFACSLCGLCTQVCPLGLDPSAAFLALRRGSEASDRPEYRRLLAYERRGTSPRYTWRALPEGCDAVFFPGCALPGTRPGVTLAAFERLREAVPNLGIVLDCCTKPSHDLGRAAAFEATFGELRGWLVDHGVKTVLVACPNCHKVFREHGAPLAVRTVYEVLAERAERGQGGLSSGRRAGPAQHGAAPDGNQDGASRRAESVPPDAFPAAEMARRDIAVHDPCAVRGEEPVHAAVRALAARAGLTVSEMPHAGANTLCCGEGGAVSHLEPALAAGWTDLRRKEAGGLPILTYCAGCAAHLGRSGPVVHVLDALFAEGRLRASRPPFTYWNRLRLKARLRRSLPAAVAEERPAAGPAGGGKGRRLALFALVLALVAGLRLSGAHRYLDEAALRTWIGGLGAWGPAAFVALYAVAPSLLLPGLPLTVAAGVLFGPAWGVVYALSGATLGACLAFLVARYAARGWVESRLTDPRWKKLDEEVGRQGWKVVAFTRLIPLFPFNLLNYAFGLTRVRFVPYAVTTFFGMLPACVAFVVFSSSLLDLLKGRVSARLAVGALLLAAVSSAPILYRRLAGHRSSLRREDTRAP